MAKIFVEGPMHAHGRALLEARTDITFTVVDKLTQDALATALRDADGLVLRLTPLNAKMIAGASKLKVVSRYGVGYDHIDVAAMSAKKIPLAIVGDALSASVAEHTLALMLAVTRQIPLMDGNTRNGRYGERYISLGREMLEKTVLLIGLGKIGLETAKRCAAFGMTIIVAGREASMEAAAKHGYEYVADFRNALGRADFVSLHLPAQQNGRAILGADEFAAMKKGAHVINTARGSLIDEAALYDALTSGTLAGAGLDVTNQEPPAEDCPLLALSNIVFTPHNAALTEDTARRVSAACVGNLLDGLDGKLDPANVVNREVL